jgi:hypothetical protein
MNTAGRQCVFCAEATAKVAADLADAQRLEAAAIRQRAAAAKAEVVAAHAARISANEAENGSKARIEAERAAAWKVTRQGTGLADAVWFGIGVWLLGAILISRNFPQDELSPRNHAVLAWTVAAVFLGLLVIVGGFWRSLRRADQRLQAHAELRRLRHFTGCGQPSCATCYPTAGS